MNIIVSWCCSECEYARNTVAAGVAPNVKVIGTLLSAGAATHVKLLLGM